MITRAQSSFFKLQCKSGGFFPSIVSYRMNEGWGFQDVCCLTYENWLYHFVTFGCVKKQYLPAKMWLVS